MTNGFCAGCGEQIGESTETPTALRKPCPNCGSLSRRAKVDVHAELELRADPALKARTPSERKPFLEEKTGDSFWRRGGKWMRRVQTIDRRGNRYRKRVEDPETGEVIRDVDEPLTSHRGFGDAKKKEK